MAQVKDNFKKEANDANLFESKHSEEETGLYDDNGARTRPELSSREVPPTFAIFPGRTLLFPGDCYICANSGAFFVPGFIE